MTAQFEKGRKATARRRARAIAGLCSRCDRPSLEGIQLCADHRARARKYQSIYEKTQRILRIELGQCLCCESAPLPKRRHCAIHTPSNRAVYMKRWRDKRKERDLCSRCASTSAPGRRSCVFHLRKKTEYQLKRKYKITPDERRELYEKQEGLCAICQTVEPEGVDHDHATGTIRGLLCDNCNSAIGMLKDNIAVLRNAITYLGGSI